MSQTIQFYDFQPALADFKAQVLTGLSAEQKYIPPRFFYDKRGSQLFDQITELPEYYPARTEISILQAHGEDMATLMGNDCLLLELGSGSSRKIRVLLDALQPSVYMPLDISKEHLLASAQALAADYPKLQIHAACADYCTDINLPYWPADQRRAAFFPGSSLGNFDPAEAESMLRRIAAMLGEGGALLVGIDLKKDPARLHAAYNDEQQVTARFNCNLLQRMNRELNADFDLSQFRHYAFYNPSDGRIEMHLISLASQTVEVAGVRFHFRESESIHTENSYKYTISDFQALAASADFQAEQVWTDADCLFSVHCLRVNSH